MKTKIKTIDNASIKQKNNVKIKVFDEFTAIPTKFIMPPVVAKINNGYVHVKGKIPDAEKTPCLVLESTDPAEYVIFACANEEKLSTAEKAIATKNYVNFNKSKKQAKENLMSVMNEAKTEERTDFLLKIAALPFDILKIIHEKKINVKNALDFILLNSDDLETFSKLTNDFKLTAGEIIILAEMLYETGKRDELSFREILLPFFDAQNTAKQSLIEFIRKTRYPETTRYQKEFIGFVKELNFPPQVSLNYDQLFEDSGLAISLKFKSVKGLEKSLDKIYEGIGKGVFDKMFDFLNE